MSKRSRDGECKIPRESAWEGALAEARPSKRKWMDWHIKKWHIQTSKPPLMEAFPNATYYPVMARAEISCNFTQKFKDRDFMDQVFNALYTLPLKKKRRMGVERDTRVFFTIHVQLDGHYRTAKIRLNPNFTISVQSNTDEGDAIFAGLEFIRKASDWLQKKQVVGERVVAKSVRISDISCSIDLNVQIDYLGLFQYLDGLDEQDRLKRSIPQNMHFLISDPETDLYKKSFRIFFSSKKKKLSSSEEKNASTIHISYNGKVHLKNWKNRQEMYSYFYIILPFIVQFCSS